MLIHENNNERNLKTRKICTFFNKMFCKPRKMKKKKKTKKKKKRFHPIWFPPSWDDGNLFYVHLFNNSALLY
jgi:hypothetical protein